MAKVDIFLVGSPTKKGEQALEEAFTVHRTLDRPEIIRAVARSSGPKIDGPFLDKLPKIEIVASFGVGYDAIDAVEANKRGIMVTNTPDVLTEEVADTALGLLLMTVRELSATERFLRAGNWVRGNHHLTDSMRNRTVGIAGLGRIGLAIARRLDAMQVPVVYHTRHPRAGVPYRYFSDLGAMADAVDTLLLVLPGSASTDKIVNADILKRLGKNGVLINVGRGSAVDEPALIAALKDGTIKSAGLDVFADEPRVPAELMALPNAVLLPHVGSGSQYTRDLMWQLVVDNLVSWFTKGKPITPVPETPVK